MKRIKRFDFISFIFFIFTFGYIFIRAYITSFTHDESLSYTIIQGSPKWIASANNHYLNTLLMKFFKNLFGISELSLRFPNVIIYVLYFLGTYLIIKKEKSTFKYVGYILLIFNPFLIEFFSLARGYGLSYGFMIFSIYFMLKKDKTIRLFFKNYLFALVFASLAVLSNLVMINYLIAVILIFSARLLFLILNKETNAKSIYIYLLISSLTYFPLSFGINSLLVLKKYHSLYFGAKTISESFSSIIKSSIYFDNLNVLLINFIKVTIIIIAIIGLYSLRKKSNYRFELSIISFLLGILILGLFFEHYFFEAKYPIQRSALYFVPILGLFNYFLFLHLKEVLKEIHILNIISAIITLAILINFINSINLSYTKTWRADAHTKQVMQAISKFTNIDKKKTISNHWFFEPSINYYIDLYNINMIKADRKGVNTSSDYIYKFDSDAKENGYKTLIAFPDTNNILLIHKMPNNLDE